MEGFFRFDPGMSCSSDDVASFGNFPTTFASSASAKFHTQVDLLQFEDGHDRAQVTGSDVYDLMKTQIASHPRYPDLVSAYIECQKVGAPPEMAALLEELARENYSMNCCSEIGVDPLLDQFMESYCEVLHRYKEELSKPFDEATTFLSSIESQLSSLCEGSLTKPLDDGSDEPAGTSEEEMSCGELEASESQESTGSHPCGRDLKGMLLRKYSGYLSNLRKEFLSKRKKGNLPKDARKTLLDWWNNHYKWPYPTEEEKTELSEITGLNQKQINNWFINQRKRHWKPTENMRFALMEGVTSSCFEREPTYADNGADGI